jgi:hypothetical protein
MTTHEAFIAESLDGIIRRGVAHMERERVRLQSTIATEGATLETSTALERLATLINRLRAMRASFE